jgi:DNA-binding winged helix-turn-helix (wHTH) protein/tetratricopeptide (TPR) repeat protein
MDTKESDGYRFGPFQLLPNERLLLRDGRPVALTPKVFDTLLVFVENSGRLLTKDELMRLIWPHATVEEGNLSQNIFVLRKSLGENPPRQRYIVTIPLQGYRFVAKVRELHATSETAVPQTKLSPVTSLAVLPFKLLGDEREDRHLGAGIADALGTRLSRIGKIIVRPTTAVLKYSAQGQDPVIAGREQSVDAVLDGVVQRVGPRIRVGVQLIRIDTQQTLWGDQFEEEFTDMFALQDSLSEQVARLLMPELSREERDQLFKNQTDDVEAYALYIKGRYFWDQRTEEGLRKGLESAQQMIALDPDFALAHVGLADSYSLMGEFLYLAPGESFPKARAAAVEALKIDPSLAEAHATLAEVALFFDWDWSKAEEEYQQAIALNPHYASAHHWYAWFLLTQGRIEEARASLRRARTLDPGSLTINTVMGLPDYYERQYDLAISHYQYMLQLNPDFPQIHYYLGTALAHKGLHREATIAFKKVLSMEYRQQTTAMLGYTYGVMGEKSLALETLQSLNALSEKKYVSPYLKAVVYSGLGELDEAIVQLETAFAERASWMIFLKVDPFLDRLRGHKRFEEILRRLGFTS